MASNENEHWILARRPEGDIRDGDLVLKRAPMPSPAKGEVVVRNEWLSLDPTNRVWMSDMDQYLPPVEIGAPMRGFVCGKVVASDADALPVGTSVMGTGTWSRYSCVPASELFVMPEVPGMSRQDIFGQLYIVGPTAYFGLVDYGKPKIGDTLVVSGAAGAVGSLVGQLGKVLGCKVIGIAGGADKCKWITGELGFDAAIDYKKDDIGAKLRELCPEGVDVYFDNVGGDTLNILLTQMRLYGRIVQCGLISMYNNTALPPGPSAYPMVLMQRLTVKGFVVLDELPHRLPEAARALAKLHKEGKIKWRYHVADGLESADKAVRMLFKGTNNGKMLVKIADPA